MSRDCRGKSGVGGGILGIVPGVASLAVWSPGLNANGNSKLGSIALEKLAKMMTKRITSFEMTTGSTSNLF
jgi:glutaminase